MCSVYTGIYDRSKKEQENNPTLVDPSDIVIEYYIFLLFGHCFYL